MNTALISYAALFVAITSEVIGTSAMQASQQFTRIGPTLLMGVCYLCSLYFLSLTLRNIPLGIAYGIWGGLGIVLTSVIGLIVFKQKLDLPALIGLGFIVGGVLIVNLFSKTISH